jgi:hypothetical protein
MTRAKEREKPWSRERRGDKETARLLDACVGLLLLHRHIKPLSPLLSSLCDSNDRQISFPHLHRPHPHLPLSATHPRCPGRKDMKRWLSLELRGGRIEIVRLAAWVCGGRGSGVGLFVRM